MIVAFLVLALLVPTLVFILVTIIAVVTFGVGSFLYAIYPVAYIAFLLVYPWSIYWGYNCYQISNGAAPVNTTASEAPQQPQQPMEQQPQQPVEQQPMEQQQFQQVPMEQQYQQQPMEQQQIYQGEIPQQ